jgi:hypothetical protein
MKRMLAIFATLSANVILSAGVLFAQSTSLSVTIPFDFRVGDAKLSAGAYSAKIVAGSFLILQSKDGGPAANVSTTPIAVMDPNHTHAKLVFARYGNEYFLRQAFWPGYDRAFETLRSKHELEVAGNRNKPKALIVTGDPTAVDRR